jgi:hypothetical protein
MNFLPVWIDDDRQETALELLEMLDNAAFNDLNELQRSKK